jgi:hypothetical protein
MDVFPGVHIRFKKTSLKKIYFSIACSHSHGGEGRAHHVVGGVVAVHGRATHRSHRRLHPIAVNHTQKLYFIWQMTVSKSFYKVFVFPKKLYFLLCTITPLAYKFHVPQMRRFFVKKQDENDKVSSVWRNWKLWYHYSNWDLCRSKLY